MEPIKKDKLKEVLIGTDALKNIVTDYNELYKADKTAKARLGLAISLAVTLVTSIISVCPSWSSLNEFGRYVIIIFSLLLLICDVIYWVLFCVAKKKTKNRTIKPLEEMIENHVKNHMNYTGILRIAYKSNGDFSYLVGNDFFLPHCYLNSDYSIDEQETIIRNCLHKIQGIKNNDILNIIPTDNIIHYSIKPIHGSIQMNAFVFYDIKINVLVKQKFIQQNETRKWVTLKEMRKSTSAMSTNKDVIDLLDSFTGLDDSFINPFENIKIIWNITNKCDYNCAICATHDGNRKELDIAGKIKVLNNISTAKSKIKDLDFAGGDPLQDENSIIIIQTAIESIGNEKISVTTTGKGIIKSKALSENRSKVKHCEVTIDAAHYNLSGSGNPGTVLTRAEDDYSENNIKNLSLVSEWAQAITINIPIINDDLSEEEISLLIEKIRKIKEHSTIDVDVSILRLMPVGKAADYVSSETYKKYNPIHVIKCIKEKIEEMGIPCKLHCSLRVLPDFQDSENDYHCNMLESKLGVDCAGNVFACAWSAYCNNNLPINKNPFYLGNLTTTPLIKILNGESKTNACKKILNEIESKSCRKYCSLVSYYLGKELFDNCDSLSKGAGKK